MAYGAVDFAELFAGRTDAYGTGRGRGLRSLQGRPRADRVALQPRGPGGYECFRLTATAEAASMANPDPRPTGLRIRVEEREFGWRWSVHDGTHDGAGVIIVGTDLPGNTLNYGTASNRRRAVKRAEKAAARIVRDRRAAAVRSEDEWEFWL